MQRGSCFSDMKERRGFPSFFILSMRPHIVFYLSRLILISVCLASSMTTGFGKDVNESPPFDFNPLLDDPPFMPQRTRVTEWTQGASGFRVSSFLGLSFGSAASYLSPRISSLDIGTFPLFGLSLGVRLGGGYPDGFIKRLELGINAAVGFGRTFEQGGYDDAIDLHFRPTLTTHIFESQSWGVATSVGLNAIIFDSEDGEVSQLALGSYLAPRLTWKTSDLAQLYLEFGWSYIYDFLAYSFREPTEEEIEDNPQILEIKEKGDWFNHYQLIIGLRLLGF
jgi:hypothetical protein